MSTFKKINDQEFLRKLERQAKVQANLERNKFLPKKTEAIAWCIAKYPWQTLIFFSGTTAAFIYFLF